MWELDHKEGWAPKNWCFQIIRLEKTLESPLDRKEIKPITLLQEGGPLPGPKTELLSNTQKWIVWGDTCADKARYFIGKGHPGGEQQVKGTQENNPVTWLAVSGFMVMGLVSGLSLANHSDSESFLVVHACSAKMGVRKKDSGRWSDMWGLLLTFPELFLLVEAY